MGAPFRLHNTASDSMDSKEYSIRIADLVVFLCQKDIYYSKSGTTFCGLAEHTNWLAPPEATTVEFRFKTYR